MTPLCSLLASPNAWEISVLIELVPPVLAVLVVVRTSPSPWVWVVIVCHANLSFWAWVTYFLSSHSCSPRERRITEPGSSVFNTGIVFLAISGIICLIAALANDQYFPSARLTVREAKAFLDHLRTCRPSQKVILSSAFGSLEGRDHVKAVYPVASWEDSSTYPDLSMVGQAGDMALKITLTTTAYDDYTEEDFENFVGRFAANNGVDRDSPDLKIIASIIGGRTQLGTHRRGYMVFPTVRSDQTCRVYIYSPNKPLIMEFFLRTAWIFNILAISGPVLATFLHLKNRTEECKLVKTYKSFSSTPLPACLVTPPTSRPGQAGHHLITPTHHTQGDHHLSAIVPSLITYQILHRPARQPSPTPDLPPSYSVLQMDGVNNMLELDRDNELPSYEEATQ